MDLSALGTGDTPPRESNCTPNEGHRQYNQAYIVVSIIALVRQSKPVFALLNYCIHAMIRSLFGGPLSTRLLSADPVLTSPDEPLSQRPVENKTKNTLKPSRTSNPPLDPPLDPQPSPKSKKRKLNSDLAAFDDLNDEHPSGKVALKPSKGHATSQQAQQHQVAKLTGGAQPSIQAVSRQQGGPLLAQASGPKAQLQKKQQLSRQAGSHSGSRDLATRGNSLQRCPEPSRGDGRSTNHVVSVHQSDESNRMWFLHLSDFRHGYIIYQHLVHVSPSPPPPHTHTHTVSRSYTA